MRPSYVKKIPHEIKVYDYTYELFLPSILKPYREWFQPMYFSRLIRLMIQAVRGSIIFYMKDNTGNICGLLSLERGGGRYPWSTKNDWVISPYAVKSEQRGKGIGTQILLDLKTVLSKYLQGKIYAEVLQTNIPSQRAMEKADFSFLCYAKNSGGLKRKYIITDNASDYCVYEME